MQTSPYLPLRAAANVTVAQPAGLPPLPAPTMRDILARCIAVWTTPVANSA